MSRCPSPDLPHSPLPSIAQIARIPIIFPVLMAAALVLNGCGGSQTEAATEAGDASPAGRSERPAVAVSVEILVSETVTDEVVFPADLFPLRRAVLAAEITGTVEKIKVREGQGVRKRAELIAFDTRSLQQRVSEAEAIDRQRRLQFERAQALLERRSITQMQFLDAQTARDVAGVQLAGARLDLEKSKILAPWSGTVAVLHPEVGDYVGPGQPLLELVDTSVLEVRATAPSSDVPFLRPNLSAEVRIDAFPGETFSGQIVRLATELDPGSRTLEVIVEIDNSEGRLRPGLAARVNIARRQLANTVLAPLSAIIELEEGHVAYVEDGGRAAQRRVRLGPVIGADRVIIEDGLTAGDPLIVKGQMRLSPGQRVAIDATEG